MCHCESFSRDADILFRDSPGRSLGISLHHAKGLHDDLGASNREGGPRNYTVGSAAARFREAQGRTRYAIRDPHDSLDVDDTRTTLILDILSLSEQL